MQLDIFNTEQTQAPKRPKPRNVHAEAKDILDRAGVNEWSKELKALVASKLMAEHFPAQHKIMMQMLATTSIIETAKARV